jgi:hypothetical protein
MAYVKQDEIDEVDLPDNFLRKLQFAQDWLPQIPRDREQMVNEVILRFSAGLMSPERALEMLGDVEYIGEEIERIKQWIGFKSQFQSGPGNKDSITGSEADTILAEPAASSGLSGDTLGAAE